MVLTSASYGKEPTFCAPPLVVVLAPVVVAAISHEPAERVRPGRNGALRPLAGGLASSSGIATVLGQLPDSQPNRYS